MVLGKRVRRKVFEKIKTLDTVSQVLNGYAVLKRMYGMGSSQVMLWLFSVKAASAAAGLELKCIITKEGERLKSNIHHVPVAWPTRACFLAAYADRTEPGIPHSKQQSLQQAAQQAL